MTNTTASAAVARLTVTGRGADRERDALAAWLRGNPVSGRGWLVSAAAGRAPEPGSLGGGGFDLLEVVLTGGLSAAQLIVAVLAWQQGRAAAGRRGIGVCLDCGGTRIEIKDAPPQQPDGQ